MGKETDASGGGKGMNEGDENHGLATMSTGCMCLNERICAHKFATTQAAPSLNHEWAALKIRAQPRDIKAISLSAERGRCRPEGTRVC